MLSVEEIYKQYSKMVYRYLLSFTASSELAEELTQETFYQAMRTIHKFEGNSKVSTWLCGIAKNVWKTYLRKHPEVEELTEKLPHQATTEETVLADMSKVEILRKIYAFEGEIKDVLYLRLFGDLSFREIGDILGRTENWARVTYYRGKEKLRKELEAYET